MKRMTPDEIIAVVQAHKEGKPIECQQLGRSGEWETNLNPLWDFLHWVYRVKRVPREKWVNEYPRLHLSYDFTDREDADRCQAKGHERILWHCVEVLQSIQKGWPRG